MKVSLDLSKPAETNENLPPAEPSENRPAGPRRPRAKQVSSRFMTPLLSPSSKSSAAFSRSAAAQRRIALPAEEPQSVAEQRKPERTRSSETPLPSGVYRKSGLSTVQRKPAVKLFKEPAEQKSVKIPARVRPRPGSPVATCRLNFQGQNQSRVVSAAANSAAAKLLQSSLSAKGFQESGDEHASAESSYADNFTISDFSESDTCSIGEPSTCESPPINAQTSKIRTGPELRSSVPERNLLPTMSTRLLAEDRSTEGSLSRVSASPCCRSLNSALSNSHQHFIHTKSISKPPVFSRTYVGSAKVGSVCLPPPHPSNLKEGNEPKKGKGDSGNAEGIHSLKLLHNSFLQWRFANAKAEAAMNNQRAAVERLLHTVVGKTSDLHKSVSKKQMELKHLKSIQTLTGIMDAQMPYLEEWETLEEEYASSLSGVTRGLQDASVRLPTGIARVDTRDLHDALDSASNMLEAICPSLELFLPKAERVDNMLASLAMVVSQERTLTEECGVLLSKAHMLQVEECSFRCHQMQLKQTNSGVLFR